MHIRSVFTALVPWLLTCLLAMTATADTVTTEKTATGSGTTQAEATSNALVNAIQQVQGVGIDTARSLQTGFTQILQTGPGGTLQTTSQQVMPVPTQAKGFIESYRVTSAKKVSDHEWQVTVAARVKSFDRDKGTNAGLKTLAIAPFRRDNVPARYDEDINRFVQELTTAATSSGKFRILDRQFVSEYSAELNDLYSDTTHPEEALRIGQKLGADYLLVGNFDHFDMHERIVDSYAGNHPAMIATGILHYRLIDVARREVRLTESLPLDSVGEIYAINKTSYVPSVIPPQQQRLLATQQLMQKLASAVNSRLLEAIHGIRPTGQAKPAASTPAQQTPATNSNPVSW